MTKVILPVIRRVMPEVLTDMPGICAPKISPMKEPDPQVVDFFEQNKTEVED
jgi:hypothetical protein